MPQFETMPAAEAPQPMSKVAQEQQRLYAGFVSGLPSSEVGVLTPEGQETPRAIKLRLSRAAKALGKEIQVWEVENKVYFKFSATKTPAKRGRPRKQE